MQYIRRKSLYICIYLCLINLFLYDAISMLLHGTCGTNHNKYLELQYVINKKRDNNNRSIFHLICKLDNHIQSPYQGTFEDTKFGILKKKKNLWGNHYNTGFLWGFQSLFSTFEIERLMLMKIPNMLLGQNGDKIIIIRALSLYSIIYMISKDEYTE